MLSPRQEAILRLVVTEHVDTAQPIGSALLARKYDLGISPATIRGEMAELEEAGLLTHPHPSAGRVPSARGYRHYIEYLMDEPRLPAVDRHRILHQFHQVEWEVAEWTRLAAAILARLVHNAAVVTVPTATASRLQRIDVIPVGERRAWLIAVLQEGLLKQLLLQFDEPVTDDALAQAAQRLNRRFARKTAAAIAAELAQLEPIEQPIGRGLVRLLDGVDQQRYEDVCVQGLNELLHQPEFNDPVRMRRVVELLSEPHAFVALLSTLARPVGDASVASAGVQVTIGEETGLAMFHDLSIVIARYGTPGRVGGTLTILGPTRMHYARAISAARYIAGVLTDLLRALHG